MSGVGKEAGGRLLELGADDVQDGPGVGRVAGGNNPSWRDGHGDANCTVLEDCGNGRSIAGSRKGEADNLLEFKLLPLLDGRQFVHCLLALTNTQLLHLPPPLHREQGIILAGLYTRADYVGVYTYIRGQF